MPTAAILIVPVKAIAKRYTNIVFPGDEAFEHTLTSDCSIVLPEVEKGN